MGTHYVKPGIAVTLTGMDNPVERPIESYCIICGKILREGLDDYIQGCICGEHNAKMCLDCYKDDENDKYLTGEYGSDYPHHRESNKESSDCHSSSPARWNGGPLDVLMYIVLGLIFWAVVGYIVLG